jgi:hypothetical protein
MSTATLALEQLMTHPRYPELAAKLRALLPNHLVDQDDAAADDAHAITALLGAAMGSGPPGAVMPEDLPGWLRLSLLDAWVGYLSGSARTCRHNPSARSPQPVLAAAWRPDLITCTACVFLLSLRQASAEDRTCDACGHQCAGVDTGDSIYPAAVTLGPLIFQYGVCSDCIPQTPAPGRRAKPRGHRGRGRSHR